ncbi:putative inorganic phosphate cotransporter [Penaeus vannamei]|uniref:putative inorganic phosphate cotransporter n=1 Tax=Penaeus vannamei TaxID=6689 RepID=UPI00387F936B
MYLYRPRPSLPCSRPLRGFQGVAIPAVSVRLTRWFPPLERSKFSALVYAASGWLCDLGLLGGWPLVFCSPGALGWAWGVSWALLQTVPIPWRALMTSLPMLAITVPHSGRNWGFLLLATKMPDNLKNIRHFDFRDVGGDWDDWSFASYGPMPGHVALCFVECQSLLAMGVLCLVVGLNGAICRGFLCSHQDLAPNLAGMGITNSLATTSGIFAPMLAGAITNGNNVYMDQWQSSHVSSCSTRKFQTKNAVANRSMHKFEKVPFLMML